MVTGVAFTGCMAATGVGSIGCGIAAGAAGGAVANLWKTKVQKVAPFSWSGLARDTALGAAAGGVGSVAGVALARPLAALARPVSSAAGRVGSAVKSAVSKVREVAKPKAPAPRVASAAGSRADDTIDLYRAAGVREYDSVMSSGRFEPKANSLEGRQFAATFEEALRYADTDLSKVAILRVTVNRSAVEGVADFSTRIDPFIFKNGVYTVQPGRQSDLFHAGIRGINHAF